MAKGNRKEKLLLIDNYDSFSYNLFQYIGELCVERGHELRPDITDIHVMTSDDYEIKVIRNDAMTIAGIEDYGPDRIIISPGPGRPADAGICEDVIKHFAGKVPILGICLGHQAICEAFGGEIVYASQLMHGKQSVIELDGTCPLFAGLVGRVEVGRYHSLAADKEKLPDCLKVTAKTDEDEIMAVAHKDYKLYGLQFHPESILTPSGKTMLSNFLSL